MILLQLQRQHADIQIKVGELLCFPSINKTKNKDWCYHMCIWR